MDVSNQSQPDLSIVIPIYNEECNIPELYKRLVASLHTITQNYEIVFVNDGSKDYSLMELIKLSRLNHRILYINFSRNFGHQIAVQAGLDNCTGKAVVIIDADLQDPPELIPDMYKKYKKGFEVVSARRKTRKGESLFKKLTAKAFYRVLQRITSVNIPLDTGDFRLIDRKVVEQLREMPEQNKFLRGQIAWMGFKHTEVLFERDERKHGKTGYSIAKMLHFAMDGITSFSDKPLQMVTRLGLFMSIVSLGIILYAVCAHYIMDKTIQGWTSLIITSTFIGGVQMISIGIIGEYISRINKNVVKRPLYIVQSSNTARQQQLTSTESNTSERSLHLTQKRKASVESRV